jgi:LacI family transcriptional regulator
MSSVVQHLAVEAGVALAGFDEIPFAESLREGLTIVAQHPTAIGEAATDLLLRRVRGDATAPKRILIGTDLVVRRSSVVPVSALRSSDIR